MLLIFVFNLPFHLEIVNFFPFADVGAILTRIWQNFKYVVRRYVCEWALFHCYVNWLHNVSVREAKAAVKATD